MATMACTPSADVGYTPMRVQDTMSYLEAQFWRHSLVLWVGVPACAIAVSVLIPFTRPSCGNGFSNWAFLPIILIEVHHVLSERQAWASVKSLLPPPELTIMRQHGVLRRRRLNVVLGILEGMDLYTDLMFPFVARACDPTLTADWAMAWGEVPFLGPVLARLVERLGFWGIMVAVLAINVAITGGLGLRGIHRHELLRDRSFSRDQEEPLRHDDSARISAEVFFAWARSASTAMMPSVASLCEACADQRKWVYDFSKDAAAATQSREQLAFGKIDFETQQALELQNLEEQEKIQRAASKHYVRNLLVKVLLGNAVSLWLQSSFLALTFSSSTEHARVMVILSMAVSAATAIVRCVRVTGRIEGLGLLLSSVVLFVIGWAGVKVYFSYKCADHVWNLTTGCVDLGN